MNINEAYNYIDKPKGGGGQKGFGRILQLLQLLGNPQEKLKYVHVTGTNGKGSTSAMIGQVLKEAGYKTGLFTSPHLITYRERFRINGISIDEASFCRIVERVKAAADTMDDGPTVFERLTAIGFLYFAEESCDIAIMEVGLGGARDCTNVIAHPEVSVFAHVDLDHTHILGNTIAEIAEDKSGIIKENCPSVLQHQSEEAMDVIKAKAEKMHSKLTVTDPESMLLTGFSEEGQVFDYRNRKNLHLSLLGPYQLRNGALALDVLDVLKNMGWKISEENIYDGFRHVRWDGRLQVISTEPLVLLDGAHNPDGVRALSEALHTYFSGEKFVFMMGVMADKDYEKMLAPMAGMAHLFVAVRPDENRGLNAEELAALIHQQTGKESISAEDPVEGIEIAMKKAKEDRVNLCIFGSLYQAGDVLNYLGIQQP